MEAFSFVRKLLFLRKFNSCLKNDRFVKTFARQVLSALAGIPSTELSTGWGVVCDSVSFREDEQISWREQAVAEGADSDCVVTLLQVEGAVEGEP